MGQLSTQHLDHWVVKRILSFLNEVRDVNDLVSSEAESVVKDDPSTGTEGYGIGKVVAERIIEQRDQLPARRFRDITQLNGIKGFEQDKFNDLAHSVGVTAAEAFVNRLFDTEILLSNWSVQHHTTHFNDEMTFYQIVENEGSFIGWVADTIQEIAVQRHSNHLVAELSAEAVYSSYLDSFETGHYGSFAWAFWFYRFDADNWFTYEVIRQAIDDYFNYYGYYSGSDNRIEFHLFKGFLNDGLLTEGITVRDLPVTVNFAEQSISIWSAELFD